MIYKFFTFSVITLVMISCGNDSSPKNEVLPAEKQAYYDSLGVQASGENQQNSDSHFGHNHDGHDHGDASKPQSIENNSSTSVPIDRTQAPPVKSDGTMIRNKSKSQMQKEAKQNIQVARRKVPDACELISAKDIASVIGVDAGAISLKDGSSNASPYAKSCFFRWEHNGVPNSGVLLQVQDNPVPDEFPEWAAYFIKAKKTEGEKSPDGAYDFKFDDFSGLGVEGAYNFEMHRYLWRDKNDYVYLIAFNLPATEDEELDWARKLGAKVMQKVKF